MDSALISLRANKPVLYGGAGFLGAALGSLATEPLRGQDAVTRSGSIMLSGIEEAILAAVLTVALFAAAEWHQRRVIKTEKLLKMMAFGAIAGFVSGAVAQLLYSMAEPGFFKFYVLRIIVWALAGLLLGAILSRQVPNLALSRGALAGCVGGAIGCLGALLAWSALPESAEFVGRIVGNGLLGLSLGLAIHIVESMTREASIEIEWGPGESTFVSLGPTPITVGGGEDHIFIRGLAHHVSSIVLDNGQIAHVETANGKRTLLEDGSRLRIGGRYMIVHASK